jgi:hypothetical protein
MAPVEIHMPTASACAFRRATFMAASSTTYSYLVERLNDFDLVYIHIVEPRIARNRDIDPQFDLGSERFRPLIRGETRLLSAGGHTRESGNAAIASGHADVIAFGAISLRILTSSLGFGREPRSIATTAPPHEEKNPHQPRIVSGQMNTSASC